MSLYNALFGVNPLAGILLQALELDQKDIPRFRDCYLSKDGSGISIYTRTGGGNRDNYESEQASRDNYPEYWDQKCVASPTGPWNADLQAHELYLSDKDDDFDSTYATFYFSIPEPFKKLIEGLQEVALSNTPEEKFKKLLADMESGEDTPETKRALGVGRKIFAAIEESSDGGIIEV